MKNWPMFFRPSFFYEISLDRGAGFRVFRVEGENRVDAIRFARFRTRKYGGGGGFLWKLIERLLFIPS